MQGFPWRDGNEVVLKCFVDSDWSGGLDTRRSTSGGVCTISDGVEMELKHWCQNQSCVSLSSGEAETRTVVKGLVEGLYISKIMNEIGMMHKLVVYTDSSASLGRCARLGNGKRMRHLEGSELWFQCIFRAGRAKLEKINGKVNPADLYTK